MSELKTKIHYLEHLFNLDGRDNVNYLNRIIESRIQQILQDHCGIKKKSEYVNKGQLPNTIYYQPKTFVSSIIMKFTVTKTGIISDEGWK